jgi:hypothetical protein
MREAHPCEVVKQKGPEVLLHNLNHTQHIALTFEAKPPPAYHTYLCSTHVKTRTTPPDIEQLNQLKQSFTPSHNLSTPLVPLTSLCI